MNSPHDSHINFYSISSDEEHIFTTARNGEMKVWKRQIIERENDIRMNIQCIAKFSSSTSQDLPRMKNIEKCGKIFADNSMVCVGVNLKVLFYEINQTSTLLELLFSFNLPIEEGEIIQIEFLPSNPVVCLLVKGYGMYMFDYAKRHLFLNLQGDVTSVRIIDELIYLTVGREVLVYTFESFMQKIHFIRRVVFDQHIHKYDICDSFHIYSAISPSGKVQVLDLEGNNKLFTEEVNIGNLPKQIEEKVQPFQKPQKLYNVEDQKKKQMNVESEIKYTSSNNLPSMDALLTTLLDKV